jgi:hypothetical protein
MLVASCVSWHEVLFEDNADNNLVLNNGLGRHIDTLTPHQLLTFAKVYC